MSYKHSVSHARRVFGARVQSFIAIPLFVFTLTYLFICNMQAVELAHRRDANAQIIAAVESKSHSKAEVTQEGAVVPTSMSQKSDTLFSTIRKRLVQLVPGWGSAPEDLLPYLIRQKRESILYYHILQTYIPTNGVIAEYHAGSGFHLSPFPSSLRVAIEDDSALVTSIGTYGAWASSLPTFYAASIEAAAQLAQAATLLPSKQVKAFPTAASSTSSPSSTAAAAASSTATSTVSTPSSGVEGANGNSISPGFDAIIVSNIQAEACPTCLLRTLKAHLKPRGVIVAVATFPSPVADAIQSGDGLVADDGSGIDSDRVQAMASGSITTAATAASAGAVASVGVGVGAGVGASASQYTGESKANPSANVFPNRQKQRQDQGKQGRRRRRPTPLQNFDAPTLGNVLQMAGFTVLHAGGAYLSLASLAELSVLSQHPTGEMKVPPLPSTSKLTLPPALALPPLSSSQALSPTWLEEIAALGRQFDAAHSLATLIGTSTAPANIPAAPTTLPLYTPSPPPDRRSAAPATAAIGGGAGGVTGAASSANGMIGTVTDKLAELDALSKDVFVRSKRLGELLIDEALLETNAKTSTTEATATSFAASPASSASVPASILRRGKPAPPRPSRKHRLGSLYVTAVGVV